MLDTSRPGEILSQCHICLSFYTVHGVLTEKNSDSLPFPPPVDYIFSELSIITYMSWVALQGMAQSFIEFCKLLCHEKAVIYEGDLFYLTYFSYEFL